MKLYFLKKFQSQCRTTFVVLNFDLFVLNKSINAMNGIALIFGAWHNCDVCFMYRTFLLL